MKANFKYTSIFLIILSLFTTIVAAAEDEGDVMLLGLELEKLLYLISGLLATVLFILAFIAYKRDGRKRLLFVSLAFLLFAIKGFLMSSELFITGIEWIDPLAVILELAIILSFFFGVVKK